MSCVNGVGTPEQQTITNEYDPTTYQRTATVDALNRRTTFSYETKGNLTSVTRLAGTANVATTTMMYEPTFSKVQTITDALQHTTTFADDVCL